MKNDLVFKGIQYLDVKKHTFVSGDVAVKDGLISQVGENLSGENIIDCTGKFLVPGFVDSHIHLESSIISPVDFARMVSLRGTTTVVTDPHEIANVCGKDGIRWMMEKTKSLPVDIYFVIPSCVPATEFDESAYTIDSKDIEEIFKSEDSHRILGLAEVMNYPGVIFGDSEVLVKIKIAKEHNLVVDGHCPKVLGEDFEKYVGAGIESDHESISFEEAKEKLDIAEKLNKKFYIMIREGTAARNVGDLYKLMTIPEYRENVVFATDDIHPERLYTIGHIDYIIKKSISLGVDPVDAYITASYNSARYFNIKDIGSIEVGKRADLVVLDDEKNCSVNSVYKNGVLLTKEIRENWELNKVPEALDCKVRHCINMKNITEKDLYCKGIPKKVIGLVPGEIVTTDEGYASDYNVSDDILKAVVIEPHKGAMHMGMCYLKGLGLATGAIGTTVAHDSHYCIVAGTDDKDIACAVNKIAEMQGGKVIVKNGEIVASLPLPIGNLMTDENPITVIEKLKKLKDSAGIINENIDPFMNLSFISLPVIGDIRLLPGGVFSVTEWKFIE